MTSPAMTFHESYGYLPKKTLALIKKHNVSQSDFDGILYGLFRAEYSDALSEFQWAAINKHILAHSDGMYRQPRF